MGSAVAVQLEDRIPLAGMILLTPAIFYSSERAPDQPPLLLADPTARVPTDEGLFVMPRDVVYDAFHDCSPDIIEWALGALKPQGVAGMTAPFEFRPIRVPSALIRASEDRTVSPDWQEWAALALTGAPAIVIPGSHSPFLARPAFLADQFDTLAKDFASRN
jgi:pimeloyl-ACP methyl ester carboxylesterase